jgi:hypothetical protein
MSTHVRMKALLTELDFDFREFTMDRFVAWVQERKGREIRFIPWQMPPGMFGLWMSDAEDPCEHVFFDSVAPPLHQVHIQLHELAHIICDHPTARLTHIEMEDLLLRAVRDPEILNEVLLRAPNKAELEKEAETLAALIQEQVIHHEHLQQLSVAVSSDKAVVVHFKALELI